MQNQIQSIIEIPFGRNSISGLSRRRGFLVVCALACLALLPAVRAVSPPPDGGYPNSTTAEGDLALFSLTTGGFNTAIGNSALNHNTTGKYNTATGASALMSNTVGDANTASGLDVLLNNTSGTANTAFGTSALGLNTTGFGNTANGFSALDANTTGNGNIALGSLAGASLTTGSNNIDIGNAGVASESSTIRLGTIGTQAATFIAGISGVPIGGGVPVGINSNGQLGVRASSARFKDEIRPMDKASEAILALQPVTFHYKHELDPDGILQFGLVAEQVEKVNPALVARDNQGKPYTVRYEAVNAMLLNEFLKEHKAFLEEHRTVNELKKQVAALTAGLQKVSAQLELTKSATKTALNDQ
jgi:trimeric autotransporter adhesin